MTAVSNIASRSSSKVAGVRSGGPETDYVRVSVNLSRDVADELRTLADASSVSLTETVRRAINLLSIVDQATRDGARLQLVTDRPSGREVETLRFI